MAMRDRCGRFEERTDIERNLGVVGQRRRRFPGATVPALGYQTKWRGVIGGAYLQQRRRFTGRPSSV